MREWRVLPQKSRMRNFRQRLVAWFRGEQRDLPWRGTKNPYAIWISEIMLQQTRVAAVIPYYERFLERFPDVRVLAEAPEEEALRLWSGLGYYSRARNLQRAAREIVRRHGAQFPREYEAALALPGIGQYTAAAILSIAHDEPYAVLDGNVARVLARLDAVRGDVRGPEKWKKLQLGADALLDRGAPGQWNQAMMELGATVCTPKAPRCDSCPVSAFCTAKRLGISEEIPEKRKKAATVRVRLAAAVLLDARGKTLLVDRKRETKRSELDALFSGMPHFPAVKVRREAEKELRAWAGKSLGRLIPREARGLPLKTVRHTVAFRELRIDPFVYRVKRLPAARGCRVVPLQDVERLAVSNLTRKIARRAASRLA